MRCLRRTVLGLPCQTRWPQENQGSGRFAAVTEAANDLVRTMSEGGVTTVTLDDGKVNALSPAMQAAVHAGLDVAEEAGDAVLLVGREGRFSAGYDLSLSGDPEAFVDQVRTGFELCERLLAFPDPVVIAATGHAIAGGLFLLLSGDYRLAADGPYKFTANEVAIGLPIPTAAVEICRQRLSPAAFARAIPLAEVFGPDDVVAAGIVERVVPADELLPAALEVAQRLAGLDRNAHQIAKQRTRGQALAAIRAAVEAEFTT